MRRVTFSEVDSTDEIARVFNRVIDNLNQVEAKVCQLDNQLNKFDVVKPAEKKKKGFGPLKTILTLVCLLALMVPAAFGAWTINYDNVSNPENLVRLLQDRFANQTGNYFTFDPTNTTPTASRGRVFYHDASNVLQLYNGTAWLNIDTAGGNTLDGAYDSGGAGSGRAITVDSGAVALSATDAANNVVLAIAQADTGTSKAITITNAGTGNTIDIQGQASSKDIEGTGDTWNISSAGTVTVVAAAVGNGDLTLSENGAKIINDTDGEIEFVESSEDISLGFGTSNTIIVSSDTGVTDIDFGNADALDVIKGITTITGDAEDFTMSITADAAGEDLLIQQAGGVDGSLDLRSAGTGTDAIKIYASAGGIAVDATGSTLTLTNAANGTTDDFTIAQTGTFDSSLLLTSAGTGSDALSLSTSNVNGIIVVNSASKLNIDAADDIEIDLAGAAGEDVIVTNTGGSVIIAATEDIADAIYLHATTGGIDILADGAAAKDVDITCTSGSVNITGGEAIANAITLASTGGVDVTSSATFDIDLTATGGKILATATEDAAGSISLVVNGGVSETIVLTNTQGTGEDAFNIDATAGGIDMDAAAGKDINIAAGQVALVSKDNAASAISLTANVGVSETIVITNTKGTGTDAINIDATVGGIDIDSAKDVAIDLSAAGSNFDVDSAAGSVYLDGGEADAAAIKLDASNAAGGITMNYGTGNMIITGTGASADYTLDCDLLSIDATGSSNISVTGGAGEDLTISQLGSADASVIISSTGTGADALALQSATGGLDIDAKDDIIITVASTTTADDLALVQTGAQDAGITLAAAGTGDDAIDLNASAGGVDIDGVKSVTITSTENTVDSVKINSTVGGIQIYADGGAATEDIDISAASSSVKITGGEADAAAIALSASNAAGGITVGFGTGNMVITGTGASADFTVDADLFSIDGTGTANLSVTGGAGEDLTISQLGNADASLFLSSTGTGADALGISTSAGGIDITVAGAAANEDLDLLSNTSITVTGAEADAAAIALSASNAAGGITIGFGTGNMVITGTGASADFTVDADLISIDGTGTSNVTVTSNAGAEDFTVALAGATDSSLILSSTGTGADALQITASAGGIDMTSSTDPIDIAVTADGAADDLTLSVIGAQDASIILTSAGTGADAISLQIDGTGGGLAVDTDDGAISIVADGATNGDITIDAEDVITIVSVANAASAVGITANGGTSDTITITNSQGTDSQSVAIQSTAGGVSIAAGADDPITLNAGTGNILCSGDVLSQFKLDVELEAGTSETVLATDSGKAFIPTQGNGATTYTLPDAVAGLFFVFVDGSATAGDDVIIDPQVGDNIDHDTAGDAIQNTADEASASVTLLAVNGTDWITISKVGTWAQQ